MKNAIRRRRAHFWFVSVLVGLLNVAQVTAAIVVEDDFDDGVLDPEWTINFLDATGWTSGESGSTLAVDDISPTIINPLSGGTWARVILSRSFPSLGSFDIDFAFSWDSEGSEKAMQNVRLSLHDGTVIPVISAGYRDAWVAHRGEQNVTVGGSTFSTGMDSRPLSGSALVEITRVGDKIDVLWDGGLLTSGIVPDAINQVDLEFWYYAYNGVGGPSFFGNESVDLIRVQGTEIPLPGASLLFLSGVFGLSFFRSQRWLVKG